MLMVQGRQCVYCKCILYLSTFSIDHILPLSLGGTHTIANIQLTCLDCNLQRRTKLNWKPREMRNHTWLCEFIDELHKPDPDEPTHYA
jgi:5-methylcytosine-specific restriction endonuclease McrA